MVLKRLKEGLQKTREKITAGLKGILTLGRKLDNDLLEELEEKLIATDMGPETALSLMEEVKEAYRSKEIESTSDLYQYLQRIIKKRLETDGAHLRLAPSPPTVILVAGVNGSGKTTSIAKLAYLFKEQGKKVLLAASDTFRAAAVEQLEIWSRRIGADIIRHQMGADPAAVAFDAAKAAVSRGMDVLIVDTAGRLHTKGNLMKELNKIKTVLGKNVPGAPHEVLLVLDATNGQNAISQAKTFKEVIDISGLFLAKLDGTAKGGAIIGIRNEIDIPVKFIGLGEKPEDIEPFDAEEFTRALFE